jgi:hypothetical protein
MNSSAPRGENDREPRESLWSWSARFLRQCLLLIAIAALSIVIGVSITLGPTVLMREFPRLVASFLQYAAALSASAYIWSLAVELLRRRKTRPN